jgi:hypothetical protein
VYRFWLASVHAAARKELAYYDYYIGNPPTDSLVSQKFTVTPVLKSARTTLTQQYSALQVVFSGADIDVTDEIWLEFETHNNIEREFDDDLGVMNSVLSTYGGGAYTAPTKTQGTRLLCFEYAATPLGPLTNATTGEMQCVLYAGDGTQSVRRPAVLKIAVASPITAAQQLTFYVMPFTNPHTRVGQLAHVTFKVMRACRGAASADTQKCAIYTTTANYVTATTSSYFAYSTGTSASLTAAPVGERNVQHDFVLQFATTAGVSIGGGYALQPGQTYALVYYPPTDVIFTDNSKITRCGLTVNAGSIPLSLCVVLPQIHAVFVQVSLTALAASLTGATVTVSLPHQNHCWRK